MRRFLILNVVLAAIFAIPSAYGQEDHPTRLILKDGSYQVVVKYEVKGDRVRYLSAERYEWEDVPKSLVDWAATEQYAKDLAAGKAKEAAVVSAEEEADVKAEEQNSPQILPGLRLPETGGVFLLDTWREQPQLVELGQNGGDIHKNTGKNLLRATINPLASVHQTIELKGVHAEMQSHITQPVIYLNLEPSDEKTPAGAKPSAASDRFRIVRLKPQKDTRVVGNLNIAAYGKVSQKEDYVASKAEPLTNFWIKLTPAEPLTPGEYAVVELLGQEVNLYVWDFGVNPAAPANVTAWKPAAVAPPPAGTKSPALETRPK